MRQLFIAAFLILWSPSITAEATPNAAETQDATVQQSVDDTVFELSIGSSQLFAREGRSEELKQIVPTASVMFLLEWYLRYRWHIIGALNWPTAPELSFVDGALIEEFSPPTAALGVLWTPLSFRFNEDRRRLELQVAAMGGLTLKFRKRNADEVGPRAFPLFAARLYLMHDSDVGLYVGAAFALRLDTAGLIYGLGYRF